MRCVIKLRMRLTKFTVTCFVLFFFKNCDESSSRTNHHEPVDISKVSESIAKATCNALVKYLDLLVSNNFLKIAIRTTLHIENVCIIISIISFILCFSHVFFVVVGVLCGW